MDIGTAFLLKLFAAKHGCGDYVIFLMPHVLCQSNAVDKNI